jgi:hypothetical protein
MKRMKARKDFIMLNLSIDKSFEDRLAFPAGVLALDAAVRLRTAQSLAPPLHFRARDFALGLHFNGNITHQNSPPRFYRFRQQNARVCST